MPDHPVWNELERFVRSQITQPERQQIVHVLRQVMAEQPDHDLNELVVQITISVLKRRR